jgi:hypothetical protein
VVAGSAHRHTQHHANGKVDDSEPKPGSRTGIVIHGIHLMRPEARSVAEKRCGIVMPGAPIVLCIVPLAYPVLCAYYETQVSLQDGVSFIPCRLLSQARLSMMWICMAVFTSGNERVKR